ncbi:MAG TPA: lipid II flippase Amj family protein [Bacillota bacterium]|nr:lipid II flippase Amj family protein [Bacillota bacterium]
MDRLLVVAALTAVIHFIYTLSYAVRISGVRTRRLATAISLFNVIFLLATTANTFQAPLLSSIVERAINAGQAQAGARLPAEQLIYQPAYRVQLAVLERDIRLVIAAATVGTLAGASMIPSFVNIFVRATYVFEETGSVPKMIGMFLFSPRRIVKLTGRVRVTRKNPFKLAAARGPAIPKTFLALNIVVTGVFTTGVVSSLYAGALFPSYRTTAALLTAVVNGVATVLSATVVEPAAASITDQALRGDRGEGDVSQMTLYLTVTRFLGTILAQLIFLPASHLIKYVASLLA